MALITSGPVKNTLEDLSRASAGFGPVFAHTPAISSRVANRLGGRASVNWQDLASADIILLSVPDAELELAASVLLRRSIPLKGKVVVAWDVLAPSSVLAELSRFGAEVATVCHPLLPASSVAFAEGTARAVVRMLAFLPEHTIVIPCDAKEPVLAALRNFESHLSDEIVSAAAKLAAWGVKTNESSLVLRDVMLNQLQRLTMTRRPSAPASRTKTALNSP